MTLNGFLDERFERDRKQRRARGRKKFMNGRERTSYTTLDGKSTKENKTSRYKKNMCTIFLLFFFFFIVYGLDILFFTMYAVLASAKVAARLTSGCREDFRRARLFFVYIDREVKRICDVR